MQVFDNLRSNPGKLFLVDGLGASLTALLLFGILIPFQKAFGMPRFVLEILSLFALVFACYSFSCFFFVKSNRQIFLKTIATANTLYCCLTAFFVIFYFEKLTVWGIGYFVIEMIIILSLVLLEMKIAYRSSET